MAQQWQEFRTRLAPHHVASVENLIRELEPEPGIRALVLGGSLVHGFARPDSDIDVSLVVDTAELRRRDRDDRLTYHNTDLCTYPGGYIDGKYVDLDFLRLVADRGSDPARYAYRGAVVLFSRVPELDGVLAGIARYPVAEKATRITRFAAQLLAWRWFYSESVAKRSRYLEVLALQKLALFTCRIVLAANERLFPFHKWMLRETERAPHRPPELLGDLEKLLADPSQDRVDAHVTALFAFYGIDQAATEAAWPTRFMKDTELWWVHGHPVIDEM